MLNTDNTYVCHYNKLKDRKVYLENHFKDIGIDKYEFVENYNKERRNRV